MTTKRSVDDEAGERSERTKLQARAKPRVAMGTGPYCTVSHIMVTSSGSRRISWLFFKAVRAGLEVAKRPYLN
jgi:hypothetical protein